MVRAYIFVQANCDSSQKNSAVVIFVYKITAAFLFAVDNLKIVTTNNERIEEKQ